MELSIKPSHANVRQVFASLLDTCCARQVKWKLSISKKTYDYRLGDRSALERVIDQYRVSTDKCSGITNDPNSNNDEEYILRSIGQVITVSLETVKIVNSLPDLGLPDAVEKKASKAEK